MCTTVFKCIDVAARAPPQQDILAEQATPQRRLSDLVAGRRDVPALLRVVAHRSSTSLSVRERDTQTSITSPASFSASVSIESRWSGVPSNTLASGTADAF